MPKQTVFWPVWWVALPWLVLNSDWFHCAPGSPCPNRPGGLAPAESISSLVPGEVTLPGIWELAPQWQGRWNHCLQIQNKCPWEVLWDSHTEKRNAETLCQEAASVHTSSGSVHSLSRGQGPSTEGRNFMHPPLALLYLWAPLSPYGNIHSVCMACYLSCAMDTVTSCCLLFVLGGPYRTTRSSLVRLSTDAPWYHLGVLDNFSGTREFDGRVLIAFFKQGTQKARLQKGTWHPWEGTFKVYVL